MWSGCAVRLFTDDIEEDGEEGGLVGFSAARTVRGEGGAEASSALGSFFLRSAISTRRAAILAEHETCSLLGVGAVLGGLGSDGGEGASLADLTGGVHSRMRICAAMCNSMLFW